MGALQDKVRAKAVDIQVLAASHHVGEVLVFGSFARGGLKLRDQRLLDEAVALWPAATNCSAETKARYAAADWQGPSGAAPYVGETVTAVGDS